MQRLEVKGPYINLGGTWVHYATVGTVVQRQAPGEDGNPEPYCNVVLTLQGHKTLGCPGTVDEVLHAVHDALATEETAIGLYRARGMREGGLR